MKRILKVIGVLFGVLVLAVAGLVGWGYAGIAGKMKKTYDIPPVKLSRPASTGNVARGRYLTTVRMTCVECHGDDLAGGTVIEDPMAGNLYGRNITPFKLKDWTDGEIARVMKHGLDRNGHALRIMPAEDYQHMSETDMIDIIAYLRTVPAVAKPDRDSNVGPLMAVLISAGQVAQGFPAESVDHDRPFPPPVREAVTVEFGRYIYNNTCVGCHRPDHKGGKIKGTPPDWFPAANLTQDALAGWTEADFIKTLKTGVNPSGSALRNPMTLILKYTPKFSDTELKALWKYLKTVKGTEEL